MILDDCGALTPSPQTGTWFRAVAPHFGARAISTEHTRKSVSRFSCGGTASSGYELLYLTENHLTALFEVEALYGSPLTLVANPTASFTVVPIKIALNAVVDLTTPAHARILRTSLQELTGNWRSYAEGTGCAEAHRGRAPTQELGRALYDRGDISGFVAFSAKLPEYRVMGIFPERLLKLDSWIEYNYIEPSGDAKTVKIPA